MVVLIGVAWAACAAGESLWLDELHTSWAISGEWNEVADRARQGNQSPLFFYALFALAGTVGNLGGIPGELLLRFPSIVCWAATLYVCLRLSGFAIDGRYVAGDARRAMGAAIVLWLLLDRIQLFYATEARVYAGVQLVSLLAWCCVAHLAVCESPKAVGRSILLWCGLSVLLISLHLTAVLACVWQIACGTWIVYKRHPQLRMAWVAAVTIVLVALAAALQLSSQVWEQRQQWASFAGDASWIALVSLFPLAAYLVPVAAARGVDWLCCPDSIGKPRGHRPAHPVPARGPLGVSATEPSPLVPRDPPASGRVPHDSSVGLGANRNRQPEDDVALWVWWIAAAGPWLSAWCITALGIAPIFHRRFVIVAAIPLLLVAASQLARIRRPSLRWLAVIGVAVWLIASQGTLDNWRSGAWYGWQRSEGWRQASQFLQARIQPGDTVWCCSGLIEASGAELPLTESLNRYLSFPLRGLYRVAGSQGEPIALQALIGNGESWRVQLLSASRLSGSGLEGEQGGTGEKAAESFPGGELLAGDQWIVYRGSPTSLARHLQLLQQPNEAGQSEGWQIGSPQSFGLVSVVRISRDRASAAN